MAGTLLCRSDRSQRQSNRGKGTTAHVSEIIQIEDQYYVRSTSSLADAWTAVLKNGDTFAVFDRHGDIQPIGAAEQGIFHKGTRYLSQRVLRIDGERPLLLSSTVDSENILLTVDSPITRSPRSGKRRFSKGRCTYSDRRSSGTRPVTNVSPSPTTATQHGRSH